MLQYITALLYSVQCTYFENVYRLSGVRRTWGRRGWGEAEGPTHPPLSILPRRERCAQFSFIKKNFVNFVVQLRANSASQIERRNLNITHIWAG